MKTTLELPDDLVTEIKLLAVQSGQKLKDAVADLLRQGLRASGTGNGLPHADPATIKRRKSLTKKFVAGQWGFGLSGFEAARKADRLTAQAKQKRG